MRAVSLYIVVENIKLEPKKIGGLEISDAIDSDNRYLKGKIVSKGDLCPPAVSYTHLTLPTILLV